tara:strand:+ start:1362 stop:1526 length:165 start_codon:yes stop_codon:yes gene_type:complete
MTEYIVKTSSILVEEFTVEAKSQDEARDKWCEGDYLDVKQTDQMSTQIEEVKEK